jgi:hypothetical protein
VRLGRDRVAASRGRSARPRPGSRADRAPQPTCTTRAAQGRRDRLRPRRRPTPLNVYFDTSALIKLIFPEARAALAAATRTRRIEESIQRRRHARGALRPAARHRDRRTTRPPSRRPRRPTRPAWLRRRPPRMRPAPSRRRRPPRDVGQRPQLRGTRDRPTHRQRHGLSRLVRAHLQNDGLPSVDPLHSAVRGMVQRGRRHRHGLAWCGRCYSG